jgi:hypothetical protein
MGPTFLGYNILPPKQPTNQNQNPMPREKHIKNNIRTLNIPAAAIKLSTSTGNQQMIIQLRILSDKNENINSKVISH